MHRAEERHGEDVCHEVHEQAAVHRKGRGAQRVQGAGDPAGDRARVPGESLVSSSLPCASSAHRATHPIIRRPLITFSAADHYK